MFLGIWILKSISEFFWRCVARVVTIPAITNWLIARAQLTPYTPIKARDGSGAIYMLRFWLFNPYPSESDTAAWEQWKSNWRRHLPSARIHHILRADDDEHLHSHPWVARTIILRGWYREDLPTGRQRTRNAGDTGLLRPCDFHRISSLSVGGTWTLFTTWKKQETWYFDVEGLKVPWREYLGARNGR